MNAQLQTVIDRLATARCPEDLFGALDGDKTEALAIQYRFFARITHPDKNPGDSVAAAEAFKQVGEWRVKAEEKILSGKYGDRNTMEPVTIKTKNRTYKLTSVIASGAIADIYDSGKVAVKIVRSPANNDLMMAESNNTRAIHEDGKDKPYEKLLRHIPDITSFMIQDGKTNLRVNAMQRAEGMVPLTEVLDRFPSGIDPRDAAWMLNRTLDALSLAHHIGIVHGAVLPCHVLINPGTHDGMLVGWGASVKSGQPLKSVDADHRLRYPNWIWRKLPVGPFLDVEMAASMFLALVGCHGGIQSIPPHIPRQISGLMRTCYLGPMHRPQNAALLQEDFYKALTEAYGPRKFREFRLEK